MVTAVVTSRRFDSPSQPVLQVLSELCFLRSSVLRSFRLSPALLATTTSA